MNLVSLVWFGLVFLAVLLIDSDHLQSSTANPKHKHFESLHFDWLAIVDSFNIYAAIVNIILGHSAMSFDHVSSSY